MAQSFFKITLDNGVTPLTLTNNPAGLRDFEITYNRHKLYGTLFRSIGSSLRFVKEGFDYIQSIFYTKGIDGECSIQFEELNFTNKTYTTVYEGIIDFSNYNESDLYIEVGILDSTVMGKFLSREQSEIDIFSTTDLNGNAIPAFTSTRNTHLTPINPIIWATSDDCYSEVIVGGGLTSNYSHTEYINYGTTVPNYIGTDYYEPWKKYTNSGTSAEKIRFRAKFRTVLTGEIIITDLGSPPGSIDFSLELKKYDGSTIIQHYYDSNSSVGTTTINFDDSKDLEFTSLIGSGDSQGIYTEIKATFNAGVVGSVTFNYKTTFEGYEIIIIDTTYTNVTSCIGIKLLDVGNRILQVMGIDISATPFNSSALDVGGDFEDIVLTNGKAIRVCDLQLNPINISFRTFFEMLKNVFGLLMSFDGSEFRVENISYFNGISVGSCDIIPSNFVRTTATDRYFSKIKIGYENKSYKDVNGRLEFNTNFEFATANTNTENTLDLVSKIRADSLGIEFLRRKNWTSTGTEDADGDSELFIISTFYDTGMSYWRAELGSDMASVEGLQYYEQYYNYRLTPKQNLTRHGFEINTSLNYLTKTVSYINSKNNIPLVIDGLAELDGDYNSAASSGVVPMYIEFDSIMTDDLRTKITTSLNKKITFTWSSGSGLAAYFEELKWKVYQKKAIVKIIM